VKTDENLVLVNSYGGRCYNDSPKIISEYLNSHIQYSHLHIIWAFDDINKFNIPFDKIKINSCGYFYTALKAKYWISCVNIERGLCFKKKSTRYLNTGHGIPLKLVGNAAKNGRVYDFSNVDIFCCSGNYDKAIYIRDFMTIGGNILNSGLPRNDELYNEIEQIKIDRIKKQINIPTEKKVILYVPTWRDSKNGGNTYNIEPPINVKLWEKYLTDEYILLLRCHPFTTQIRNIEFNGFIRNVSNYPEVNELMIIADILISDYSSIMFDYSILGRPIICFAYDYDEYYHMRGFYIDLKKEIPGGIIREQREVIERIKFMNYESESKNVASFRNKYLKVGGYATEMCIDALFNS
jgi:CDP-glycerol glycerophosphotransferase